MVNLKETVGFLQRVALFQGLKPHQKELLAKRFVERDYKKGDQIVTQGKGGARMYSDGRWRKIGAFPHREVDPTGAGDVFATAFVIALEEKGSVEAAARFAAAAAGLSVEAQGIERVATRPEIEAVLTAHPEVTLE